VQRINSALETHGRAPATFIGCLDIAGFEIFDVCRTCATGVVVLGLTLSVRARDAMLCGFAAQQL
jgi:hypothetical protein